MKKDLEKEIIAHLEEYIGAKATMIKTIPAEGNLHGFNLVVFRANTGRPYHIVATVGLNKLKMAGNFRHVEYIIYLDKDWNLFSEDEEYSWVYRMIQNVASGFHSSERAVNLGQTYFTEGSDTFSPYTEMSSALIYRPLGIDNDAWSMKMSMFKRLDFFLITTATYKEYRLIKRLGGLGFIKKYLLDEGDIDNLVIFNQRERDDNL